MLRNNSYAIREKKHTLIITAHQTIRYMTTWCHLKWEKVKNDIWCGKKCDLLQFSCKEGWSQARLSTAISLICWQLLKPSSHACTAKTLLQFLYCYLSLIMKCHLVLLYILWGQQGIMQHIKREFLILQITGLYRLFLRNAIKG